MYTIIAAVTSLIIAAIIGGVVGSVDEGLGWLFFWGFFIFLFIVGRVSLIFFSFFDGGDTYINHENNNYGPTNVDQSQQYFDNRSVHFHSEDGESRNKIDRP